MKMRKMQLALSAGALALSLALAGCGGGGSAGGPTPAQIAAQDAKKRAEMQAEAIETALTAVRTASAGIDDMNPTQDQVDALDTAVGALDTAVMTAETAEDMDAATLAAHRATVADWQNSVTLAQLAVERGTTLAAAAETQRVMDVSAAREAAMQSYMDADAAADKAEQAAMDAAATSPGSQEAMDADAAAKAARMAAKDAKAAHDAIMDGMTKPEADAEAQKAADAATDANDEYMTAKMENDNVQAAEMQRVADVSAAREAAMQSYMDAKDAADKAEQAAKEAKDADADSQEAMDADAAAKAARMAANAAKDAHDAIMDGMTKPEADAEAQKAADAATDADTQYAAAKMENDNLQAAKMEEQRKAGVAAATKAADTKEAAIMVEAGAGAAGLGGSGATDNEEGQQDGAYDLAIAYDDGQKVTITLEGDAKADNREFVLNDSGMHVLTHKAGVDGSVMEEVAAVFTDIKAPKAVAFAKFEDADGMMSQGLDVMADDGQEAGEGETNDALAIDADNLSKVMASEFSVSSGGGNLQDTVTLTFDHAQADGDLDTEGNQPVEAAEVMGMFNGAPGTYICAGAEACTVNITTATGALALVSTGWVFVPDEGATSDQPDYDYLHYGFWLKKTTDKDGVVTYDEVETFAGAVGHDVISSVTAVEGIAKYEGGAAGVYVHKTFKEDGTYDATSGDFSADASLTAYFSGGDTPFNKNDTLTGTINNFMLSGKEENDWSVTLQSDSDLVVAGIQGSTSGSHSGTASGGVMGQGGSFSATFHGDSTPDETTSVAPHPSAVTGEFNSFFTNGSVAGAFGANLMSADDK